MVIPTMTPSGPRFYSTGRRYNRPEVNNNGFGPAPFKAVRGRYKPVVGGRWGVRRDRTGHLPWRAFTTGKALRFNKRFATQQEAIEHAQAIALMFADPTFERLNRTLQERTHWKRESIDANILRYLRELGKQPQL